MPMNHNIKTRSCKRSRHDYCSVGPKGCSSHKIFCIASSPSFTAITLSLSLCLGKCAESCSQQRTRSTVRALIMDNSLIAQLGALAGALHLMTIGTANREIELLKVESCIDWPYL